MSNLTVFRVKGTTLDSKVVETLVMATHRTQANRLFLKMMKKMGFKEFSVVIITKE